jgi:hypothetical protein
MKQAATKPTQLKESAASRNTTMEQKGMAVSPPSYGIGFVDNLREQENRTGLPDNLKAGIENLSGLTMDDVRVHYNSSKPAELQALAYTQGTDIHLAPGQEQHLPHETWHVVQQKQGRVRPMAQIKRIAINDDEGLETEADGMGIKALHITNIAPNLQMSFASQPPIVQRQGAFGVKAKDRDDTLSLIHRVEPEEGTQKETVRVYLTVFARAEKDKGHKDIHSEKTGIKIIHKTEDTMVNLGDPRRAYHYIRTYVAQNKGAIPIVRSFDIPQKLYDEITEQSVSESQRSYLGRDKAYNVDKERGQNQFGVPPDLRDKIEKEGKNLISYVLNQQVIQDLSNDSTNGTVRHIDELSKKLGMPDVAYWRYLPPMNETHVLAPRQEAEYGVRLATLYDDLDDLVCAMEGIKGNPLHVYEFQIKSGCSSSLSSNYYGDDIAPLVSKEGWLPGKSVAYVRELKDQVGKAATFSVIPQMVNEEYLQANAKLHGQARDKNLQSLSDWASQQKYNIVDYPVKNNTDDKSKRNKLSDEEITRLQEEAKKRKNEKEKKEKEEEEKEEEEKEEEDKLFGGLF